MPYIGRTPLTGAYQLCDTITTSATATYNLLVGGSAVIPGSANNCIVSLNGVVQAPVGAFTVSGSQITFASALTASDVIDFILILGNVFDIGTPTNGAVTNSSLNSNVITGQTAETTVAGGDLVLLYDDSASALRKMTRTNFIGGLTPAFSAYLSGSTQSIDSGSFTKVSFDAELFDTNNNFASGTFTPTVAGYYQLNTNILFNSIGAGVISTVAIYKNGSNYARGVGGILSNSSGDIELVANTIAFANGTTDTFEVYVFQNSGTAKTIFNDSGLTSFNGCLVRNNV